jgi:hypothetical protein
MLVTPEVSGATYSWNGPSGAGISTNDTLVITTIVNHQILVPIQFL